MTCWDATSSACAMAFQCGSTVSATSSHHHDLTEITVKVTLNESQTHPIHFYMGLAHAYDHHYMFLLLYPY